MNTQLSTYSRSGVLHLKMQQLKTNFQVLIIAREVERGLGKKRQDEIQRKLVKKSFQLKGGEDSIGPLDTPLAEKLLQPLPQQMRCGYCLKFRHYKRDCRMANKVCLACESDGHLIRNCSVRWMGSTTPIQPTLPVPPVRRDPGPIERRTSFPSPQYVFNRAQRRSKGRANGRKQKAHHLTVKETEVLDKVKQRMVPYIWNEDP